MRGFTERDRRLGRFNWESYLAVGERAVRRSETWFAEGIPPPVSPSASRPPQLAEHASIDWSGVCSRRWALGRKEEAAEAWLRMGMWSLRAHRLQRSAPGPWKAAQMVQNALHHAIVAGDGEAVAALAEAHDPADPDLWKWGRILVALLRGDEPALRAAAEVWERQVPPEKAGKQKALPRLGAAAVALYEDDAEGFQAALDMLLGAFEAAVRRGRLRGSSSAFVRPNVAALWRLAVDRGFPVRVDERLHEVRSTFLVSTEAPFEGRSARGERFAWPVDLLPTALYARIPELRAAWQCSTTSPGDAAS